MDHWHDFTGELVGTFILLRPGADLCGLAAVAFFNRVIELQMIGFVQVRTLGSNAKKRLDTDVSS